MGRYVMKFILNKLLLIQFILLLFFNVILYSLEKNNYDTVNVRKAFFLYEKDWDKFINKNVKIDNINKIGFFINLDNGRYEIRFFLASDDWKNIYSYGRFDYQFDIDKELLKVKVYLQKDNNSYIYFDKNNQGKFDIYLFGKIYKRNLLYYFPFESLKTISLYKILSLIEENKI